MVRIPVSSPDAPKAIGPYSQAVRAGNLVYLSGQTPIDPSTGKLVDGDIALQTGRVFTNLGYVLKEAGLTFENVVKVNVYLTDMNNFASMNEVYGNQFTAPFPARTTVAVAALPLNALIEIEMIALRE
jgi:2-iminobutanoate/2-iminopropanoate deaminase